MCNSHGVINLLSCIAIGSLIMGLVAIPISIRGASPDEKRYAWAFISIYIIFALCLSTIAVGIAFAG